MNISKPTLSEHLKHLTKLEILVRQEEGIQKVTYRISFERLEKLDENSKRIQEILTRHFQQEKMYKSLPIGRKIDLFHTLMILQSLMLFKLEILSISNPEKEFEYSLSHYSTVQHFGIIKNLLLNNIRDNPEELEQATKELADLNDRYMEIFFKPKNLNI